MFFPSAFARPITGALLVCLAGWVLVWPALADPRVVEVIHAAPAFGPMTVRLGEIEGTLEPGDATGDLWWTADAEAPTLEIALVNGEELDLPEPPAQGRWQLVLLAAAVENGAGAEAGEEVGAAEPERSAETGDDAGDEAGENAGDAGLPTPAEPVTARSGVAAVGAVEQADGAGESGESGESEESSPLPPASLELRWWVVPGGEPGGPSLLLNAGTEAVTVRWPHEELVVAAGECWELAELRSGRVGLESAGAHGAANFSFTEARRQLFIALPAAPGQPPRWELRSFPLRP